MHTKFKQHKYNFNAEAVCIIKHQKRTLHIKSYCSAENALRFGHKTKNVPAFLHTL